MNDYIDKTYWMAIAHLPKWAIERINRFIIQIIHENKMTWADFFELDKNEWKGLFDFDEKELSDLELAKADMPRLAFIAEQLQNEGFQIIPINSQEYPVVLKENLKIKNSPPVIYIKGRKGLLQEDAVAIVGSRKAGDKALLFTDYVAKKSVKDFKVVVSGFAKGVDKQALDSTIEANGKSIIVLPQGILTFQSGFKQYYEPIANGDVLVLSTFFPKAGWDVGFAMARNAYIYGLANEIYVAESDSKGGTWEGAMDGLRRGRKIYVRYPEPKEKNANLKLLDLGAFPVDIHGAEIKIDQAATMKTSSSEIEKAVEQNKLMYVEDNVSIEKNILNLLSKGVFSAKEIDIALQLHWDLRKLTNYLKNNPRIKTVKGSPLKFTKLNGVPLDMFQQL
jgi:predicted Rossmann fold nucleotide-binding protein DprA/Smf involved in DNA uptake